MQGKCVVRIVLSILTSCCNKSQSASFYRSTVLYVHKMITQSFQSHRQNYSALIKRNWFSLSFQTNTVLVARPCTVHTIKELLHYMVIILVEWKSSRYIERRVLQKSFSNHLKLRAGLSWERSVCCCGWCVRFCHFKTNHTPCLQSQLHFPAQQWHLICRLWLILKTIFTTKKKVKLDCQTEKCAM